MGYYVAWKAPAGPDRGIDVIAFSDPLGVKGPRLKAQVRRQLTYKAAWRGGQVVLADRFFPSSKLCHVCGHKLEDLALDVRHWTCPGCGTDHDRDLNAARNLEQMVTRKRTASSAGSDACGAEKSMFDPCGSTGAPR